MSLTETTARQPGHDMTTRTPVSVRQPPLAAGARPRAIVPTTVDEVWRIANMAIKSKLNPRELDTPEKCTIAILHGLEVGLPPMLALQRITVINNRPAIWGDAVPGIALGTGQVEDIYERYEGEGDNRYAICRVKRKGMKTPAEVTFSVADAKTADLWDAREKVRRKGRDGSYYEANNDSPWHRYPDRMLRMRARAAFRDLFADAFSGLYIAEELIGKDPEVRDITPRDEDIMPAVLFSAAEPEESLHAAPETGAARPLPPLAGGAERQPPRGDDYPAFRAWVDGKLGEAKTVDALAEAWTRFVEPHLEEISDDDQDNLQALYQEHEERVTT
jgi:hypothetical protein